MTILFLDHIIMGDRKSIHDGNSDDDDDGDDKTMTTMSDDKCKENLKEY